MPTTKDKPKFKAPFKVGQTFWCVVNPELDEKRCETPAWLRPNPPQLVRVVRVNQPHPEVDSWDIRVAGERKFENHNQRVTTIREARKDYDEGLVGPHISRDEYVESCLELTFSFRASDKSIVRFNSEIEAWDYYAECLHQEAAHYSRLSSEAIKVWREAEQHMERLKRGQ